MNKLKQRVQELEKKVADIEHKVQSQQANTVSTWEFGIVTFQEYVKLMPRFIKEAIDKRIDVYMKNVEKVEEKQRLEKALLEFVERASKDSKTVTTKETEVLPAMAHELIELWKK